MTWHRTALPVAGGVGDQDERTMRALEVIADEHQRLAVEAVQRARRYRRRRQWEKEKETRRAG